MSRRSGAVRGAFSWSWSALALLCGACAPGAAAKGVSAPPDVRGVVTEGGVRPLLVDWGPNDRTLLTGSRQQGPLVVGFVDGVLEPLFNCHVNGQYSYAPSTSAQVQDDIIENADELHAKMPAFGVNFAAALQRAGKLHVRMKVVGMYTADKTTFAPEDLRGDCARATHVATYVTVGAFRLFTLSSGELGGDVAVPVAGAGAGGSSKANEQNLNEAGEEAACDKATAEDKAPPGGCTTSLQLVLAPLVHPGTPVPEQALIVPATSGRGTQKTLALVAGGVGVVGLGVGAVLGGMAISQKNSAQSACPGAVCANQSDSNMWGTAASTGNASTIAFAVGGVAAATGVVLWLTGPSSQPATPTTQVGIGPGGIEVTKAW